MPKYIPEFGLVRLRGDYIEPLSPYFIRDYMKVFRAWLFTKYLGDAARILEFGCGPAYHLADLAKRFPGKPLVGLDWAEPSQEIIAALEGHFGWPITGKRFDFFHPDPDVTLTPSDAVLTFGALEQLGGDFEPLLSFLLDGGPQLCLHVEGLEVLYDRTDPFDDLAWRYNQERNYLSGFLSRLQELQQAGHLEILATHRHAFGDKHNDTFSYVVWRPVAS